MPINCDGELYDPANLQTLCRPCHILKTMRENSRKLTREETLVHIVRKAQFENHDLTVDEDPNQDRSRGA